MIILGHDWNQVGSLATLLLFIEKCDATRTVTATSPGHGFECALLGQGINVTELQNQD